jgi:hypothetical protein
MTVYIRDAHTYVPRLVSVVKMATVFEVCTTEEQRSVVRFRGQNDSRQMMFIKKCFLFSAETVCCVKRLTVQSRNYLKDVQKSQMIPDQLRK